MKTILALLLLVIVFSSSFGHSQNINHWLDKERAITYLYNIIEDFEFYESENPQIVRMEVKRVKNKCLRVKLIMRYADGYQEHLFTTICSHE